MRRENLILYSGQLLACLRVGKRSKDLRTDFREFLAEHEGRAAKGLVEKLEKHTLKALHVF